MSDILNKKRQTISSEAIEFVQQTIAVHQVYEIGAVKKVKNIPETKTGEIQKKKRELVTKAKNFETKKKERTKDQIRQQKRVAAKNNIK